MSNIPVYEDPVSDKVIMETNPAYQVLSSDQNRKGPDPAYQELSSDLEELMLVNQLEMLTIMKTLLVIKILL